MRYACGIYVIVFMPPCCCSLSAFFATSFGLLILLGQNFVASVMVEKPFFGDEEWPEDALGIAQPLLDRDTNYSG
jgi:hypothetical protein